MNNQKFFVLWFGITLFTYIFDLVVSRSYYQSCITYPSFHLNQFIHHLVCYFVVIGWLSDDFYVLSIHALACMALISHHNRYSGCSMTNLHVQACGLDPSFKFRSIYYFTGLESVLTEDQYWKLWRNIIHVCILITLVKLYRRLC